MVDWTEYSSRYDNLLRFNPAYIDLIEDFREFLNTIPAPSVALEVDPNIWTTS